ncbi:hypothetical protein [Cohnella sp. GbtcB17]|uniref:hypothetical protein n=1 Tax=Cohnella sp. GbtcB17 TaxID=2824762 RepID=UPI001C2F563D|nr:hypothetical protein [Cohnella sp. GbtcB17]
MRFTRSGQDKTHEQFTGSRHSAQTAHIDETGGPLRQSFSAGGSSYAPSPSAPSSPGKLLQLQRAIGNQAVRGLVSGNANPSGPVIQRKPVPVEGMPDLYMDDQTNETYELISNDNLLGGRLRLRRTRDGAEFYYYERRDVYRTAEQEELAQKRIQYYANLPDKKTDEPKQDASKSKSGPSMAAKGLRPFDPKNFHSMSDFRKDDDNGKGDGKGGGRRGGVMNRNGNGSETMLEPPSEDGKQPGPSTEGLHLVLKLRGQGSEGTGATVAETGQAPKDGGMQETQPESILEPGTETSGTPVPDVVPMKQTTGQDEKEPKSDDTAIGGVPEPSAPQGELPESGYSEELKPFRSERENSHDEMIKGYRKAQTEALIQYGNKQKQARDEQAAKERIEDELRRAEEKLKQEAEMKRKETQAELYLLINRLRELLQKIAYREGYDYLYEKIKKLEAMMDAAGGSGTKNESLARMKSYLHGEIGKAKKLLFSLENKSEDVSDEEEGSDIEVIISPSMTGWEGSVDHNAQAAVNQAIHDIQAGGITFAQGQFHYNLSVNGHMQGNLVKVYIDQATMGGGTTLRAIFRLRRSPGGKIVVKLIAIINEHGAKGKTYDTLHGNAKDQVNDDEMN